MLAGLVGTAGAITSLVSYPALVMVGIPPLSAGAVNIVAGASCWPGAAIASQPELAGNGRWLRSRIPLAAAGGAVGAGLLLVTPPGAFVRIVPFLIAAGSIALLLQPRLSTHRWTEAGRGQTMGLGAVLFAVSVYSGYFGAGSGVMLLALFLVTVADHLPTANALKNMMVGAACLISAVALIAFGAVEWGAAIPLAAGMFLGSLVGPRVARWMPAGVLRLLVAAVGLAFAAELWFVGAG